MIAEKLLMRLFICATFSILGLFLLCGTALGGPLYKYRDENGVVSYTDDPSDTRYKYERVQSYEPEKKEKVRVKEDGDKAGSEKQVNKSDYQKETMSPEDTAEKDRMLKKVAELEGIKKTATNEKYKEMLQSEIDLLKKQLNEIDEKYGGGLSHGKKP